MLCFKYIPLFLLVSLPVLAENLTIQGVGGTMDAHGRSPVLTVDTEKGADAVTITADAYVKHSKYTKYPIRYQFFINRKLVSTQFSSPELPGNASIKTDETLPFNYTVVADLIYPNRTFSSVIQGAVMQELVNSSYNCNLGITGDDGEVKNYDGVAMAFQKTASEFTLNFESSMTESGAIFEGDFTVENTNVTGMVQVTTIESTQKLSVTGSSVMNNGTIRSLNLVASDGSVTINCE